MQRTVVSLVALALIVAAARAAPQRVPLRQFFRMVLHRADAEDAGRYFAQTSVREYRHPDSKISVVVISSFHVGSIAYFKSLERFTKDAQIILAEGTGGHPAGTDVEESKLPEDGKWIRRNHRATAKLMSHVTEMEWDRHCVDERWVMADMGAGEMVAAMKKLDGPLVDDAFKKSTAHMERVAEIGTREQRTDAQTNQIRLLLDLEAGDRLRLLQDPTPMDQLSELREAVMWSKIKETVATKKYKRIVFIAGARHAQALAPRLREELGFHLYSTAWRDVFEWSVPRN